MTRSQEIDFYRKANDLAMKSSSKNVLTVIEEGNLSDESIARGERMKKSIWEVEDTISISGAARRIAAHAIMFHIYLIEASFESQESMMNYINTGTQELGKTMFDMIKKHPEMMMECHKWAFVK